ncbi:DUF1796 family putative cysteine peptidase [Priestia megaterium]|uniref:DUF1796 family putative cysteine peptidase n=1 Tax=Priestia megaterium TaxID=1404 RepID=UPI00101C12F6|nr:DUF1796 family putative cysteine peptidase [Priestia megaterium]
MNLQNIKRSYDVIVSLGSACNPAMKLREHNLRRFSGPIDWSVSHSLSDVNRLLKNKFDGFMELNNMRLIDGSNHVLNDGIFTQPIKSHYIQDMYYNIISVHDFPVIQNQDWTATYPSYKKKLNYRIDRFMDKITTSQSVLFIRWSASYEQTTELISVLSEITQGEFNILILNPVEGIQNVIEVDWELDNVCSVNVPNLPFDDSTWDYVLNGIKLTS